MSILAQARQGRHTDDDMAVIFDPPGPVVWAALPILVVLETALAIGNLVFASIPTGAGH